MAKILLTEYAKRHGRLRESASQKAARGCFQTAEKIGRDWWIDEDEPYTDGRVTTGKYRDWRKKKIEQEAEQEQSPADE